MAFSCYSFARSFFIVQLVSFISSVSAYLGGLFQERSYSSSVELSPPFHTISISLTHKQGVVALLTIHSVALWRIAHSEVIVLSNARRCKVKKPGLWKGIEIIFAVEHFSMPEV
jgi:hypothetical protein